MRNRRGNLSIALAAAAAITSSARAAGPVQWDPSPGTPGVQGGSGLWNTSNSNWVGAGANNPWSSAAGDTAVFGVTPGTVQLPTSTISAAGLQFDVAGYQVTPGSSPRTLTLTTGAILANADATITNPLALPAGLTKTGDGTLTLGSLGNTITGAFAVQAGTLAFSAEANLGTNAAGVSLSGGGRLQYTASGALTLAAARVITVTPTGGGLDTPAGTVTFATAGQLAGPGLLTKSGAGTLQLVAANLNFSGAARVTAGTLTLTHPDALNGRPVTLAGGKLTLRADAPQDFRSPVTVTADAALDVDRTIDNTPLAHAVGDLAVNPAATLTLTGLNGAYLTAAALDLPGALRLNNAAVRVTGPFSGAGPVTFGPATRAPESLSLGLVFANARSQTVTNPVSAATPAVDRLVLAVATANTTVTYAGPWSARGAGNQSYVELRDGATFVAAGPAHLSTTPADLTAPRPFTVNGNGPANTFDLAADFVADHTPNSPTVDALASLELRGVTLVTRATPSLPLTTLNDGSGGTHRAGRLTFGGTAAVAWRVADSSQSYDGNVTFLANATLRTDADLTHAGTVASKFDGQFQIPTPGVTLTKAGPARLTLAGAQGYAPGATLNVTAGAVRFNSDPGAAYVDNNFTRGPDGNLLATPPPTPTLNVVVTTAAATAEFAAPANRIASLQLNGGATARLLPTPKPGQSTLSTPSLSIAPTSQLDLANGRLLVNYTGPSGPALATVAALVKSARNPAGPRWQGPGLTSSAAAADPTLALGYAEAADVLKLSANQTAPFGNDTADATTVLVRLTRAGDADLDGMVTFADLQRLERGYNKPGTWATGDFDYDGQVTRADYRLLLDNYDVPLPTYAPATTPPAPVPEPTTLGWLAAAATAARRRRRKA